MRFPSFYRLQFNKNFTFRAAIELLPYLEALGVSGVYASPFFDAEPGSLHGYDVTSPERFFSEIGTEEEFVELAEGLKSRGMGLVIDLVANHMAASVHNPWWWDVLSQGESSPYAPFFDIDFHPPQSNLQGKVLVPVLPAPLKEAVLRGIVRVEGDRISVDGTLYPKVGEGSDIFEVLEQQHYRLGFWQEAAQEINYRRFFDIAGLAALCIEREEVFTLYHKLAFSLIERGLVTGLRIDHPDGIYDPKEYLDRLQKHFDGDLYVVVEKILQRDEELPDDWPVAGTVGYEFLGDLSSLFVDQSAEKSFDALYYDFIGEEYDPEETLYHQKKQYALLYLTSEMRSITHRLYELLDGPGFSPAMLEEAIVALFAAFPVYRTYIGSHDRILCDRDRAAIERAFFEAKSREERLRSVFSVLEEIFAVNDPKYLDFLMRFQQLSPPIMAKGLEDTFCYTYNRFVALNEVGAHPLDFGIAIDEFHSRNRHRAEKWPHTFLTVSTHDTKRSHDVRMRLAALSEMPNRFRLMVEEWHMINSPVPIDANTEYLFYQNLLGAWPISQERMIEYMIKAAREAKVHTNWVHHNPSYEGQLRAFVTRVLEKGSPFLRSFVPFAETVAKLGEKNTIASLTLFLGSPGVVDIYQGSELWDFSLVDPDNRRPVDYEERKSGFANPKLFHLHKGLHFRREHPDLFLEGSYEPIDCGDNIIGFAREKGEKRALFFARRFFSKPCSETVALPFAFSGHNIFTGKPFGSTIDLGPHGTAIVFCQRGQ